MNKLSDMPLYETLPANLARDETVKNICESLRASLSAVTTDVGECLILARLDDLSEELIDELAWQYHVDFYDESLTLEKKRNLVKIAIATHRIKGTKKAVENVVSTAFDTAEVEEWFDYGGKPYHFRVSVAIEESPDTETIASIQRAIDSAKNVRSWCDDIRFTTPPIEADIYMACAAALDVSSSGLKENEITVVSLATGHYMASPSALDVSISSLTERTTEEKPVEGIAYKSISSALDVSRTLLRERAF